LAAGRWRDLVLIVALLCRLSAMLFPRYFRSPILIEAAAVPE
jgi:hypothetical protein